MSLTYQEATSKLLSLADFERKTRVNDPPDFHLKRIGRLLGYLGNPHLDQKYVHVAGSKGKGSTAAMIAWSLAASGYTTGLFTSPSIHRITERFRINGQPISENDFAQLVEELWPAVERVTADNDIGIVSVFELETAMAFCHFANTKADISVIEVGLGGRLDSTNIITPLVSVITPISLDHIAVLGDSIELIAAEKAGIIKPAIPTVMSSQRPEAATVIRSAANSTGSELIEATEAVEITNSTDHGLKGTKLEFSLNNSQPATQINAHLRLLGKHQIDNARTAVATLSQLNKIGLPVKSEAISTGLETVEWPARNQLVCQHPNPVFVDGAHNDASAKALCESVKQLFPERSGVVLIVGSVRGHNPEAVVRELSPLNPRIVVTESRHPKSLTGSELADVLGECKIGVDAKTSDTHEALSKARALARAGDLILATGSLFVAAEIIEQEHGIEPELYPDMKLPTRPR